MPDVTKKFEADVPDLSPTLAAKGGRLWLYPDRRTGPNARRRRNLAMVLMLVYIIVPWLSWNDLPLIRVDLRGGMILALGQVFRFSEVSYVALIAVALILLLFLVTAVGGRLWCGYACPQTVFVEWLIRPIEELFEGSAHHRRRQDAGPRTPALVMRKIGKHATFLLISAILANVFLAYFAAPKTVLAWMQASPVDHPFEFGVSLLILGVIYFDLAWFREQFCAFLCPYARLQSVMMDRETPTVAYDPRRGEPRGKRASGDCIDCGLCQRVCPTGIDIRNGLQLECINCFRCADACNVVMGTLQRPSGLIRAAAVSELEGAPRRRLVRPRVIGLTVAFLASVSLLGWSTATRQDVTMRFQRQAGPAFSRLPDGRLANSFTARIVNNSSKSMSAAIEAVSENVQVICGACEMPLSPFEERRVPLILALPADSTLARILLKQKAGGVLYDLPAILPGSTL